MSLKMTTEFKGLTVVDAIYSVDRITIQGGQLDFFVSMRAAEGAQMLDGENYGCPYNSKGSTPEEQAYAYLMSLDLFKNATEN